jgi:hypothetical protein
MVSVDLPGGAFGSTFIVRLNVLDPFHATSSAPLGSFELFVQVTAFDSALPNNPVPNEPSITVIAGQVGVAFVNQGGIVVQPGGRRLSP